jgi:hypothetical protein
MIDWIWAILKWGMIVISISAVIIAGLMALHAWSLSAGDLD